MKELILLQLLPALFDWAIVAALGLFCALFKQWTGIQIDDKHKNAFQSALTNGAKLLLIPGGRIDDAIDYVMRSVPDALKRFDINTREDVHTYLEPHLLSLQAATGREFPRSNPIRADPK
ncbi:hypothetical protein [Rhizobium herbae]